MVRGEISDHYILTHLSDTNSAVTNIFLQYYFWRKLIMSLTILFMVSDYYGCVIKDQKLLARPLVNTMVMFLVTDHLMYLVFVIMFWTVDSQQLYITLTQMNIVFLFSTIYGVFR